MRSTIKEVKNLALKILMEQTKSVRYGEIELKLVSLDTDKGVALVEFGDEYCEKMGAIPIKLDEEDLESLKTYNSERAEALVERVINDAHRNLFDLLSVSNEATVTIDGSLMDYTSVHVHVTRHTFAGADTESDFVALNHKFIQNLVRTLGLSDIVDKFKASKETSMFAQVSHNVNNGTFNVDAYLNQYEKDDKCGNMLSGCITDKDTGTIRVMFTLAV